LLFSALITPRQNPVIKRMATAGPSTEGSLNGSIKTAVITQV